MLTDKGLAVADSVVETFLPEKQGPTANLGIWVYFFVKVGKLIIFR